MLYINLKNGRVYKYLNLALNATNNSSGEMMVCYKDFETETIYVREEKEFLDKLEPFLPEGGYNEIQK